MSDYRPTQFNILPDVIKNLLIINGLFFMGTVVFESSFGADVYRYLGLYMPSSPHFMVHQLITHMFMHGNFGHILFNMFALWMFGNSLENVWGGKRFLVFYLVTGLGAALLYLGINMIEAIIIENELIKLGATEDFLNILRNLTPNEIRLNEQNIGELAVKYAKKFAIPTVGASGAVFGILLAFGMLFPNVRIYLYFAIPIKAKYFVIGYGLFELYNGLMNDPSSNIAHFAHLGGMLFGFILIKYWRRNGEIH